MREAPLQSHSQGVIVGVADQQMVADSVIARIYAAQEDIRQRLVAVGGIGVLGVERSARADRDGVDVRRQVLIVGPVPRVADIEDGAGADTALHVNAGVLHAVEGTFLSEGHMVGPEGPITRLLPLLAIWANVV